MFGSICSPTIFYWPVLEVEVHIDEQVIDSDRQRLHSRLNAQVCQVADAADVEDVWLLLADTRQHRVPPPDHHVAIVAGKANAIAPWNFQCAVNIN